MEQQIHITLAFDLAPLISLLAVSTISSLAAMWTNSKRYPLTWTICRPLWPTAPLSRSVIFPKMENLEQNSEKAPGIILFLRATWMFLCLFGIFYAIVSILVVKHISLSFFLGLILSAVSGYVFTKIKMFHSINNEIIELKWKSDKIAIPIQDVLSISKAIRFTLSDNFLWIVRLKSKKFGLLNFYVFPNVKEYNLKVQFKSVGIPLKNIS